MPKWTIWFIISVPLVSAILYFIDKDLIGPSILYATLIAILIYTWKTGEMADATKSMALETSRQVEVSSKVYTESKDPVVSFNIIPNPNVGPEMWTPVVMSNLSDFDTSVWVNLNLKADGRPFKVRPPHYTSEAPWNLQARGVITAPGFPLIEVFKEFGTTREELQKQAKEGKETIRVTIEITINYTTMGNRMLTKPAQHYHFNFKDNVWIYDV